MIGVEPLFEVPGYNCQFVASKLIRVSGHRRMSGDYIVRIDCGSGEFSFDCDSKQHSNELIQTIITAREEAIAKYGEVKC